MKEVEYKKELQNRTIDPSPDSWERLNNKLTAHQNKQNTKKRSWLKYTAVIVVLVSVGIYFLRPDSHVIDIQSKESPLVKEKINKNSKINNLQETVTTQNSDPEKKPDKADLKPVPNKEKTKVRTEGFATVEPVYKMDTSFIKDPLMENSAIVSETLIITENPPNKTQTIDDEVAQLLSRSQIKLSTDGPHLSTNKVIASSLLMEVESDLDKALKEKLIEKIANTLKNPKEVVTFQEN